MSDKIIAAAIEAGWHEYVLVNLIDTRDMKRLSAFYALAYRAGMERAAEICETEWDSDYGKRYGEIYAETIRAEAHAKNQPESTHDTGNV